MLCDLAVVNYQDLIGILDGIQAVSNHKQGLTLYQLRNSLLNIAFIVGINTCGSFVQNNDRRILQNTARNRNTLFLTAGKSSAAFSNHGLEPVRQSHDEIIAAGFFAAS